MTGPRGVVPRTRCGKLVELAVIEVARGRVGMNLEVPAYPEVRELYQRFQDGMALLKLGPVFVTLGR